MRLLRSLRLPGLLALLSVLAAAGAAETTTIRLGTLLPSGTPQHVMLQTMAEQWTKASDGAVKVILYPDGRLGGEAEMVKKMRIKQLGACLLSVVGLSEIDPGVTGLQLMPLTFRSWDEVDFVREKLRPLLEQRLRARGFEVLFWGDGGWVRFFSKQPGLRPSDYQKMKMFVWAGDAQQSAIMQSVGYQPVGLETSDIPLGLNTDMINAVPLPPFIALASQFYSAAPHMLDLNWVPIVGAAVIRSDLWAKLSADQQQKLRAAAEVAGAQIRARSRLDNEESVRVMQQHGLQVHTVPPDAVPEWDRLAAQLAPRVRGPVVPAEIFDEVQRQLAEYRRAHPAGP